MNDEDKDLGIEYFDEEPAEEPEKPQEPPQEEPAAESEQEEAPPEEPAEDDAEPFSPAQQKKLEQIINRNTARLKSESERSMESARQQWEEEYKAKYGAQEEGPPDIPDMPEPYTDDYDDRLKAREEAIAKRAEWEADQRNKAAFQQERQREARMQELQGVQTTLNTYFTRGDKAGIERGALESAGKVVGESALSGEIIGELVNDENGPEINVWLAKHPDELDKIAEMSPMRGWAYLNQTVRPKATRKKPAPPPEPAESPKGKGAPPSEDPDGWELE